MDIRPPSLLLEGMATNGIKEQFVVDAAGNRVAVLLGMEEYEKIKTELEELEELRAYDAAMISSDETIPFEQAVAEIKKKRA